MQLVTIGLIENNIYKYLQNNMEKTICYKSKINGIFIFLLIIAIFCISLGCFFFFVLHYKEAPFLYKIPWLITFAISIITVIFSVLGLFRKLKSKPAIIISEDSLSLHNIFTNHWKTINWDDVIDLYYPNEDDDEVKKHKVYFMKITFEQGFYFIPIKLIDMSFDELFYLLWEYLEK